MPLSILTIMQFLNMSNNANFLAFISIGLRFTEVYQRSSAEAKGFLPSATASATEGLEGRSPKFL